MADFTSLDWFWTGSFLLLMAGGAFFFYRPARRSESDFFLAGRGLPWWLPASPPVGGVLWSVIVPALLLAVAVGATVLLYRHFAGREQ